MMKKNSLLALETTTDFCSAALWHQGEISCIVENAPREHAKRLLPMVDTLLKNANLQVSELDGIAVTKGPGTFTGVRTGLSVAQGLALPHQLPLYAVSSLLVMAEGAKRILGKHQILTAMDARMEEVYYAGWQWSAGQGWQCILPERVCPPAAISLPTPLSAWHGVGIGWDVYQACFPETITQTLPMTPAHFPLAQDALQLVLDNCQFVICTDALSIEPCYLRNDVADKSQT